MKTSIPNKQNLFLAIGCILINLYQYFILPLVLLPNSKGWYVTCILLTAMNLSFFALIHEAIHKTFHQSSSINNAVGRLLAIFCFGTPFAILRSAHILHHKYNRNKAVDIYNSTEISKLKFAVGYYFTILCGIYLEEVAAFFPFFLPTQYLSQLVERFFQEETVAEMLFRKLIQNKKMWEIRIDAIAIISIYTISFLCYGRYWYLFVIILATRGFFISFFDNVYHYGTSLKDTGMNLLLFKPFSAILLNMNLHGVHHKYPYLPWNKLSEVFKKESSSYDGKFFTTAINQLSGPISISELKDIYNQI